MAQSIDRVRFFIGFATAATLSIAFGCSNERPSSNHNLETFVENVVGALSTRDVEAVTEFVSPSNVAYFEENERMESYRTFIRSMSSSVPESKRPNVRIEEVEVVSDGDWYFSGKLFERIPTKEGRILEVSVSGSVDGEAFGVGLALSDQGERFFLLVPDVTELWGLEKDD